MQSSLWQQLCSYDNLLLAHTKARQRKTNREYVREFEQNLRENLHMLQTELLLYAYRPVPLTTFILRDPKTRKISKSAYRDRVVQHALCSIIIPIFDKSFLYHSFANRKGKGPLKAVASFEKVMRKVSRNFTRPCYVFKADIYHYFEEVDHTILLRLISRRIEDKSVLWLIHRILENHVVPLKWSKGTANQRTGLFFCLKKGMPLGNLTSQFFANIYLHELDWFVKHTLKAKHYIRYVDDFVILHHQKTTVQYWQRCILHFLQEKLLLLLHPQKQHIREIHQGITFLGFRIFPYYKLLRKSNVQAFQRTQQCVMDTCDTSIITYDGLFASVDGWIAYAKYANTFGLRNRVTAELTERFPGRISSIEIDRWLKTFRKDSTIVSPASRSGHLS